MKDDKVSRKALKTLLKDSIRDGIAKLELPAPTKKIKKLISKSSKELAAGYVDVLKKSRHKKRKDNDSVQAEKGALKNKKGKRKSDVKPE